MAGPIWGLSKENFKVGGGERFCWAVGAENSLLTAPSSPWVLSPILLDVDFKEEPEQLEPEQLEPEQNQQEFLESP